MEWQATYLLPPTFTKMFLDMTEDKRCICTSPVLCFEPRVGVNRP